MRDKITKRIAKSTLDRRFLLKSAFLKRRSSSLTLKIDPFLSLFSVQRFILQEHCEESLEWFEEPFGRDVLVWFSHNLWLANERKFPKLLFIARWDRFRREQLQKSTSWSQVVTRSFEEWSIDEKFRRFIARSSFKVTRKLGCSTCEPFPNFLALDWCALARKYNQTK